MDGKLLCAKGFGGLVKEGCSDGMEGGGRGSVLWIIGNFLASSFLGIR